MVLSDLAKGGLESGVWIDEYNYQNKEKQGKFDEFISPDEGLFERNK